MRLSTANNHVDAIIQRMDSVFRCALFDRPTLKELSNRMNEATQGYSSWSILPDWCKERVSIRRRELLDRIARDYTIQLYVLKNGDKIISRGAWDSFDEETRQFIRDGGELPIKTFWMKVDETCAKDGTITRVSRPTDDVYFDSKTMN